MKRIGLSCLFVVLALGLAAAQSTPTPRRVRIVLTVPNGGHPELTVLEGGTASVEMRGVGKFGFVPTVKPGDSTTLVVEVLDLTKTPPQKLATVETSLHKPAVSTNTTPQMTVKATYIEPR